mgnify:CR=1 FL=1
MKKKYVLFDFDGVIADTEESNSHYLGLALKEFGVELTEKDKQRLIGTHDQELLIEFLVAGASQSDSRAAYTETKRTWK